MPETELGNQKNNNSWAGSRIGHLSLYLVPSQNGALLSFSVIYVHKTPTTRLHWSLNSLANSCYDVIMAVI